MTVNSVNYCDCCGHAFMRPQQVGLFNFLEVCPKCGNPDFELLTPENDSSIYNFNGISANSPLGSRLYSTKP